MRLTRPHYPRPGTPDTPGFIGPRDVEEPRHGRPPDLGDRPIDVAVEVWGKLIAIDGVEHVSDDCSMARILADPDEDADRESLEAIVGEQVRHRIDREGTVRRDRVPQGDPFGIPQSFAPARAGRRGQFGPVGRTRS
jgi:hypothetical protein